MKPAHCYASDAPKLKIKNTKAYGAEVILYDREKESREDIGARIAKEQCLSLIRPYDDKIVIAGQGTLGLELASHCQIDLFMKLMYWFVVVVAVYRQG